MTKHPKASRNLRSFDDYHLQVGIIASRCAEIEHQCDKAIKMLSLSARESSIQLILNELSSVNTKIKILRRISKLALNKSVQKRFDSLLIKAQRVCDERNTVIHSVWGVDVLGHEKTGSLKLVLTAQKYSRDGVDSHLPHVTQLSYQKLQRQAQRAQSCAMRFLRFNGMTIAPIVDKQYAQHFHSESRLLKLTSKTK